MGEGSGQPLQAGVLMQGGDEAVVYVPLTAAAVPESVEKGSPPGVLLARDEGRDRWHAVGGSVRNLERVFDLDLPNHTRPVTEPLHKTQIAVSQSQLPPQNLPSSQATVASCSVAASQSGTTSSPVTYHSSVVNHSVSVSQPATGSHPPLSTSHPMIAPCVLSVPSTRTDTITLSASPALKQSQPVMASQPYSAFHACVASQDSEHRWYPDQECAEDLSMSSYCKHFLGEDTESGGLKRRSSDEDSDNCDISDDTVGRRVKERKRIKLDVLY